MKILFIQAISPYLVRQDAQFPLGILYLATICDNAGYDVEILRPKQLSDFDNKISSGDIVCLSGTTLEYQSNIEIANYVQQMGAKTIIGGPHVTALPHHAIGRYCFDSVVIGESDDLILQIIDNAKNNSLCNVYYATGKRPDVNRLPRPNRLLIPGKHGGEIFADDNKQGSENIITSRGCPFNCSFCASRSMWGRKVRFRNRASLYDELNDIKTNYGDVNIRVCDDNVTSNIDHLKMFCELMSHFGFKWRASVRAESLSKDICELMVRGGCHEVSVGIESGDQRVLDFLNKKTTLEKMHLGCINAKTVGMTVRTLFMIGTPGETTETPKLNKDYIECISPDIVTLSTFVPMPGTDIWDNPSKFNCEILPIDFSLYNKDYFIADNGVVTKRKYTPLIRNLSLTEEGQIKNVSDMEAIVENFRYNKG